MYNKIYINESDTNIKAGDIKVIKIPPIESVNYGRDVGYDLNELIPPDDIKEISATRIRNEL